MGQTMLKFGSLFSGIGLLDLGLERAGLECRWQVEIDPFARRVLEKHWPNARRHDDVRTFPPHGHPKDWRVDVIAGGFPCQDISNAGKRIGIDGERSGLWSEFRRVVCDLRPRYVVVENSAALLDRGMGRVLGDLAALGFDAEWQVFPAAAFGAPHLRERLFIVAYPEASGLATDLLASRPPFCIGQDSSRWRWRDDESQRLGGGLGHTQYPPLLGDDGWPRALQAGVQSPCVERGVRGATYGTADGLDRTKALGNAVLPDLAEFVGRLIVTAETHGG